jgi:hypothetical protein
MPQTFSAGDRLNILKGSHRPLNHPPSGFCRKAEAFFLSLAFHFRNTLCRNRPDSDGCGTLSGSCASCSAGGR